MPESPSKLRRVLSHVIFYTICAVFSLMGIFGFLIKVIRHGKSFFYVRPRPTPPPCLTDPELGEHSFIRLKEVKLHYVHKGDPARPLLLLLHGFPEFWYSWRHQLREFSDDFWVVAVDMRGYGDSDKPTETSAYHIDHLVSDVKQLICELGKSSCHLVAHDWGGAVAWKFAIDHSNLLDSLIILNSPHPSAFDEYLNSSFRQLWKSWYLLFFRVPCVPEWYLAGNDLEAIEKILRAGTKGKDAYCCHDMEAYKYTLGKPGALSPPVNYYRSVDFYSRIIKGSTADPSRPRLTTPVLILWGTRDFALSTPLAQMSAKYVEKCQVRLVEGASHWVQQDSPQVVNKYMREFLTVHCPDLNDGSRGLIGQFRFLGASLVGSMTDVFRRSGHVHEVKVQRKVRAVPTVAWCGKKVILWSTVMFWNVTLVYWSSLIYVYTWIR